MSIMFMEILDCFLDNFRLSCASEDNMAENLSATFVSKGLAKGNNVNG